MKIQVKTGMRNLFRTVSHMNCITFRAGQKTSYFRFKLLIANPKIKAHKKSFATVLRGNWATITSQM